MLDLPDIREQESDQYETFRKPVYTDTTEKKQVFFLSVVLNFVSCAGLSGKPVATTKPDSPIVNLQNYQIITE